MTAWLGRISYSLYAVHLVILQLLVGLAPRAVPGLALAPAGIAVSLAIATLMQRHIETPAIALGRRLTRRDQPAAVAPLVAAGSLARTAT